MSDTLTGTLQGKTFKVGDVIVVNPTAGYPARLNGKRYVITDVPRGRNGVNYKASPCDADGNVVPGAGLRGPAWALNPVDDTTAAVEVQPYVPNPAVGSLVVITNKARYRGANPGVYVVFGETDHERVRVTLIGGEAGRYWKVYSRDLTVLDPREVQSALTPLHV